MAGNMLLHTCLPPNWTDLLHVSLEDHGSAVHACDGCFLPT